MGITIDEFKKLAPGKGGRKSVVDWEKVRLALTGKAWTYSEIAEKAKVYKSKVYWSEVDRIVKIWVKNGLAELRHDEQGKTYVLVK